MRIEAVAMVRNEADLVEAFVRHTLARVDALRVVDHASDDATPQILARLVAARLPLTVARDDAVAQRQPETITRLARAAFAQGADVVVPLDADEFLKLPDRSRFEQVLAGLPPGLCAALDWQTYVPEPRAGMTDPLDAARRRRAHEAHGLHKVVLTRAFADAPQATVGPGNHTVLMQGSGQDLATHPVRLARLPATIAALGHFPVRSAAQLARKVTVGWAAHRAAQRGDPTLAFHWRELVDELAAHGPPDATRLVEIAANYGVPRARWQPLAAIELVDDPLGGSAPRV